MGKNFLDVMMGCSGLLNHQYIIIIINGVNYYYSWCISLLAALSLM
jgi:hypothetical protein